MTSQTENYYIQRKAGDPWTVEDFHELQKLIKQDIDGSIATAIDGLHQVDKAGDAEKFGGATPDDYAKALVERVLAQLPKRTGYLMAFRVLKVGKTSVLAHRLGAFPLTDLYFLDYFRVIASEDEHVFETFTTFYLYHSSESKIRFRPEETPSAPSISVEIDPPEPPPYRIPFQRMLELYKVEYTGESSLGDVENEFWTAFLAEPNDRFDDDQYCHSPWFDRCCRENRSVRQLKQRKEWDDLWFQVRPKRAEYLRDFHQPTTLPAEAKSDLPEKAALAAAKPEVMVATIEVVHFDLDTLGLLLMYTPYLPNDLTAPTPLGDGFPAPQAIKPDHIKVMALLKV